MTLSISVDTSPDLSTVVVPDTLDVSALWAPGFPSADLVAAAGRMLTPMPSASTPGLDGRRYLTSEGPRCRVVVGPGALQVARTDPARAERTSERARRSARIAATLGASDLLLEDRLADSDDLVRAAGVLGDWPAAESAGGWSDYLAGRIERRDSDRSLMVTRSVTAWSSKSRANMVRTLAQLDYAPMFDEPGRLPVMLTLTYPGEWRSVASDAAACKAHVDALKKRYLRTYGVPMVGIWKREFQRRGAPHYHILMVPPTGEGAPSFGPWVSRVWADVVGHPDPAERDRHVLAGTGLDYAEGMRARDPKRLAVYFSKHGSFGAKDYQNHAPAEWTGDLVPFADQGGVGRFWGYWGLDKAVAVVEVSPVEATALARTLRRWQAANGFRVQREVWRTDTRTGEMRKRRSGVWVGARMASGNAGFAVVNDGPAMLSTISRYLDRVREDAQAVEVDSWLSDPDRLRAVDGYAFVSPEMDRCHVVEVAHSDDCSGFVPLVRVMADRLRNVPQRTLC